MDISITKLNKEKNNDINPEPIMEFDVYSFSDYEIKVLIANTLYGNYSADRLSSIKTTAENDLLDAKLKV